MTMTKAQIGEMQRRVFVESLDEQHSMTSEEIFSKIKRHRDFATAFRCKDPYARVRTILQSECPTAKQHKMGKSKLFSYNTVTRRWQLILGTAAWEPDRLSDNPVQARSRLERPKAPAASLGQCCLPARSPAGSGKDRSGFPDRMFPLIHRPS